MNKFKEIQQKLKESHDLIFLDIETSPIKFWGWSTGKQYVTHEQIVEGSDSRVILIQWMFEGDSDVHYWHWDKKQCDKAMLRQLSELMQSVKVGVLQNGKQFDIKVLNWRLNVHSLPAMRNIQIFDTLTLSRAAFRPSSHKLDYKSKVYKYGGKIPMRLQDWVDVVNEVPGSLAKMIKYGCKDVLDLRRLFWRELPYYKNLPVSLATLVYPTEKKSREYCPKCASKRQKKFDIYPTKIDNKVMWKCNNCGEMWKDTKCIKLNVR